jgi:hypothetical protein
MPICETCGSAVKKDDVMLDPSMDRTTCPCCRRTGPVRDEAFVFSLLVTENGVSVAGRAPGLELSFADTWKSIEARLADRRATRQEAKLRLVASEE